MISGTIRLTAIAAALICLACVPPLTQVKDMEANKEGYLQANFTTANVNPLAWSRLPVDGSASSRFKRIVLVEDVTVKSTDGTSVAFRTKATYLNAGSGFVQTLLETTSNEIPIGEHCALSYHGLVDLKEQSFQPGATYGHRPMLLESLTATGDLSNGFKENTDYSFDLLASNDVPTAPSIPGKLTLHTGASYPASQVLSTLDGTAMTVTSEISWKGALSSKETFTYLQKYGLGFPSWKVNASATTTTKVLSATIE